MELLEYDSSKLLTTTNQRKLTTAAQQALEHYENQVRKGTTITTDNLIDL